MTHARVTKTPMGVYFVFLGFVILVVGGFIGLAYPSHSTSAMIAAGVGLAIAILAMVATPGMVRDLFTSRSTWLWINDLILVLSIIGIAVLLSYIGFRRHIRYDFTRDRLFSISEQTISILRNLKQEVRITAFFPTGQMEGKMIEDLVKECQRWNEKLTFKMVDPYRDPLTVKNMAVKSVPSVVVACESNRKELFFDEMFVLPNPMMRGREPPKFQGEQAIMSAVLNVSQGKKRRIVFSSTNGEPQVRGFSADGLAGIAQLLDKENFEVGEVDLAAGVPTDTTILAVVGPTKSFHPQAVQNIRDFVQKHKGMLLLALTYDFKDEGLERMLSEVFGTTANTELLINPQRPFNDLTIVAPNYEEHRIVRDLKKSNSAVLMQMCRGLTFDNKTEWDTRPFLRTRGDHIYAKRALDKVLAGNVDFDASTDVRGPFTLGIAYEGREAASGTRALVLGNASFFTNQFLRIQGNSDLFLNMVNWLVAQEELISIRPKSVEFGTINLTAEDINTVKYLSIFAGPLLIMLIGGMVWWTRRRV